MKKPFLFLILLCLSLHSFSQREISNEAHPFQVLFVEEVTIFGREVKQYDYLSNSDYLNVTDSITLIHYTGKALELTAGSYWVDELAEKFTIKTKSRNIVNPAENPSYYVIQRKPSCVLISRHLDVVTPSGEDIMIDNGELIEVGWIHEKEEFYSKGHNYIVVISNIYGDTLKTEKTKNHLFSFKADTLDLYKNNNLNRDYRSLLIISVSVEHGEQWGDYEIGIKVNKEKNSPRKDRTYSGLLNAIYRDYSDENKRAYFLYREQVRKSNQDPRFIELYEDFLERNPQIKAETE